MACSLVRHSPFNLRRYPNSASVLRILQLRRGRLRAGRVPLPLPPSAGFDEAKEREGCQKAHPNDQVVADKCFETSILEWEKAHAWVARVTHRRSETP